MNDELVKYCPISTATRVVGDFWNILIIRELLNGCKRFNELQEDIDKITSSTLSDRLKKLCEEGILNRVHHPSIPPKVEYSLTEKGKALSPLIEDIEKFAHKYYDSK